jgi:transposase
VTIISLRRRSLDIERLKQDIILYPDAYQYERAERLKVSASGVWHALRRLKVTFKKNSSASKGGFRKAIYLLPKT